MEIAVEVTLAIFVLGLAFYSGQLSNRVQQLEDWRDETRDDIKDIRVAVNALAGRRHSGDFT